VSVLAPDAYLLGPANRPTWTSSSAPAVVADEVRATVTGEAAYGEGSTFRLRARWPSMDQLDYVNKAATAALLLLGLLMLAGYAARDPGGAFRLLTRAAGARVGVS
jgi:hypothetical protein